MFCFQMKTRRYINIAEHKEQSALISEDIYETFKAVVWLGLVPTSSLIGIAENTLGVWFGDVKKIIPKVILLKTLYPKTIFVL